MKTLSVGLVLCLNLGVAPPDVVKANPCAKKECWIGDYPLMWLPLSNSLPSRSHCYACPQGIGNHWESSCRAVQSLAAQGASPPALPICYPCYCWLIEQAKCKQALDPTPDDIKKLCSSLRRRAKVTTVLFARVQLQRLHLASP